MISARVIVQDGVTERLEQFGKRADKMLMSIVRSVGGKYKQYIKKKYLSGGMLNRGTGQLYKSIFSTKMRNKNFSVIVGSGKVKDKESGDITSIKLANIYEHAGGYTIMPKNKGFLAFHTSGGWVFTRQGIHGESKPFMSASAASFGWEDAFEDSTDKFIKKECAKLGIEVIS